jgi:hypothetical protein
MTKAPGFDGTQPCASMPGDKFFPDSAAEEIEALKELRIVCNSCQFQEPCLKYSLEHSVQGIWAGTNDKQRKMMRQKQKIVAKSVLAKV